MSSLLKKKSYTFLKFLSLVFAVLSIHNLNAQDCRGKNTTFKTGEEVTYIVSYDWFVIWTEVGEIKLSIKDTTYQDKPAYEFVGLGETFKSWDWIFKVRDRFETVVDKNTLKPYVAVRDIKEGNYRQYDNYRYNFKENEVYARNKTNDKPETLDTLAINGCTFDIMSALLFARNIDFSKHKVGDTIPVTIMLDKESYPIYFRYQGIENYKLKHIGVFECIKFSVMLIEGEMFHEGENMTVWATNDKNHIVVYAESPILVGSVKVRLAEVKNNRYPFTSLKKR